MKKLVFAAVAAIALTASVSFVSCNNAAAPAADTVAVDSTATCEDSTVCCDSCTADTVSADSVVAQ